jgi:hypothetical protein
MSAAPGGDAARSAANPLRCLPSAKTSSTLPCTTAQSSARPTAAPPGPCARGLDRLLGAIGRRVHPWSPEPSFAASTTHATGTAPATRTVGANALLLVVRFAGGSPAGSSGSTTKTVRLRSGSVVSRPARWPTGSGVSRNAELSASAGRSDLSTSRTRSSRRDSGSAAPSRMGRCRRTDTRWLASSRATKRRTQDR